MKLRLLPIVLFASGCVHGYVSAKKRALANTFDTAKASIKIKPRSVEQLQILVKTYTAAGQKLSIAGTRKSQGGQTVSTDALQIDMTELRAIKKFNKDKKRITIEAGATWHDLQKFIDPLGFSVKAMQSYNSFSIGGSLSVNAHGQDIRFSSVSSAIHSFKLILANGSLVSVNKNKNPELFNLVVGGYGLFGIVVEVTVELTENSMLKREVEIMPTEQYAAYFLKNIKHNKKIELHSARLSVDPQSLFANALVINYVKTDDTPTKSQKDRSAKSITTDQLLFKLLRNFDFAKSWRQFIEKNLIETNQVITRNNAMNATIESLTNTETSTTDILQEYFVPYDKLHRFIEFLRVVVISYSINLLNVTLRYVAPCNNSVLTYAPQECCAVVLYINAEHGEKSFMQTKKWTKFLINYALFLGGTYYLPYQLFGTKQQLLRAYPQFNHFIALKKRYDPQEIFGNRLYEKYV